MACLNNIVMKSDPYVTNRLLEGIKRGATRTKLLPITRDILHEVIDNVKYHTNETYQRNLITAVILLMYHGCLRVSEALSNNNQEVNLKWNQIELRGRKDTILEITFNTYKHYKPGNINKIIIEKKIYEKYCPIRAFIQYKNVAEVSASLPVFRDSIGNPWTRRKLEQSLHALLLLSGREPKCYNTHSLRIGNITVMTEKGSSSLQIQQAERWKSTAF